MASNNLNCYREALLGIPGGASFFCANCGKYFIPKAKNNKNKYCSQKCYWESLIGRKIPIEQVERSRKKQLEGFRTGRIKPPWKGMKLTSEHKSKLGLKRENNPNWRGGRSVKANGYIYINCSDDSMKRLDNRKLEHRLVMEKKLKRYLNKEEVVHHCNENPSDNRIVNLMLLRGNKQHRQIHALKPHCLKALQREIDEQFAVA